MKFARIVDGYVVQVVDSQLPQAGLTEIDFEIPPAPSALHRFSIATRQWEESAEPELLELHRIQALARRAELLAASDWTQLPDVPLATKTSWAAYRQELRDITAQSGFPQAIVWPAAPQ
jgi:hypothetical protein